MEYTLRPFCPQDIALCTAIWNEVLEEGIAFPGEEAMTTETMAACIAAQNAATCAVAPNGTVLGFYLIHPNNIGRCSHVANASYCVSAASRGMGVGKQLVPASLRQARALGYRGMQYNAVVHSNLAAIHLYRANGFEVVGTIPGGFRLKNGDYTDMYVMYCPLA